MGSWLKRQSLPVYAAVAAGLVLAVFFVYFGFTHTGWYDDMTSAEKVKFWTDFGVSFGTIALAVVTWASVYETQQVLRGEDKRFRQSRMPVVKIVPVYTETGHAKPYNASEKLILQFMFRNEGDGPAINLQWFLTCRITVRERIVGRGKHGPTVEGDTSTNGEVITSYLSVKGERAVAINTFENLSEAYRFGELKIEGEVVLEYRDFAGGHYKTVYDVIDPFPERFDYRYPAELGFQ